MELLERKRINFVNLYQSLEDEKHYEISGKELKEMVQNFMYELVDAIPSSIYWKDKSGKMLGCNRYVLNMFGFTKREQIVGKFSNDFLPEELAKHVDKIDKKVLETGEAFVTEEYAKEIGREEIQTYFSAKTAVADGEILIGTSVNITELRKAEQRVISEEQRFLKADALQAKMDFLNLQEKELAEREQRLVAEQAREAATLSAGVVAHDLKNRLTPLRLQAEFLSHLLQKIPTEILQTYLGENGVKVVKNYPAQMIEAIDKMVEEIDFMNHYHRDLLLEPETVAKKYYQKHLITPAVQEIVQLHQARGVKIHTDLQEQFNFTGTSITVIKILSNLMGNAIRQIQQKGRGEIFISTAEFPQYFVLKFKDTAGEVTPELVENLFERYKTKAVQGTGLGLASARLWMQQLGGVLEAHYIEGGYIEFWLKFPKI